MFSVGDIITGTPGNGYGVTTRGVICTVIGTGGFGSNVIDIEIIGVDEELIKESNSSYMRKHVIFDEYIGNTYTVNEDQFEYYEPEAKPVDSSELIDFIDCM